MADTEASPACRYDPNELTMSGTIVEEDREEAMRWLDEVSTGDTFMGYFYNRTHVWFKIHDADTHEVIAERAFRGNGKAMQYILETTPSAKPEHYTLDGPVFHHNCGGTDDDCLAKSKEGNLSSAA